MIKKVINVYKLLAPTNDYILCLYNIQIPINYSKFSVQLIFIITNNLSTKKWFLLIRSIHT